MARHYLGLLAGSAGIAAAAYGIGYVAQNMLGHSALVSNNDFIEYVSSAFKMGSPIAGLAYFVIGLPRARELEHQLYMDTLSRTRARTELETAAMIAEDRREVTRRRIDRNMRRRRP